MSVYKCMRIKNERRPLYSRCNESLGSNGILCDKCFLEAKRTKIPVLMCNDIMKRFNIPFKNQVFVWIELPHDNNKKQNNGYVAKSKLLEEVNKMSNKEMALFASSINIEHKFDKRMSDENRLVLTNSIIKTLTGGKK